MYYTKEEKEEILQWIFLKKEPQNPNVKVKINAQCLLLNLPLKFEPETVSEKD